MRVWVVFSALLLAGCAGGDMPSLEGGADVHSSAFTVSRNDLPRIRTVSCEGPGRVNCKFINSPVKLDGKPRHFPESPYPFYRTRNTLKFVDADKNAWVAPKGTWTDGASIPIIFVPLIGDPRSKEFLNAATVHDAYCAKRNEGGPYYHTAPWQEVHRMFYDGLVASGTPLLKARIMYAAVYLGGPRWKGVRKPPSRAAGMLRDAEIVPAGAIMAGGTLRTFQSNEPLTKILPREALIEAFKKARKYITANHPSIDDLEVYLTRLELDMRGETTRRRHFRRMNFRPGQGRYEPESDEQSGGNSGAESSGGHSGGNAERGAGGDTNGGGGVEPGGGLAKG